MINLQLTTYKLQTLNFILLTLIIFLFSFSSVQAVSVPIGGRITVPIYNNFGVLLPVFGPRPGVFMSLYVGTIPHSFYAFLPSGLILGRTIPFAPPVPCIIGIAPCGAGLPILRYGTSLK